MTTKMRLKMKKNRSCRSCRYMDILKYGVIHKPPIL